MNFRHAGRPQRHRVRAVALTGLWLGVILALAPGAQKGSGPGGDSPPVMYFDADFEDGTLGPFRPAHCDVGCAAPSITTEAAHSGTHAVKLETTSARGWASRLEFRWCNSAAGCGDMQPCNPALADAAGLYQRFWIMLPQATIDAVARGRQLKLLLNRYVQEQGKTSKAAWWQTGFGPEFGSSPRNQLRTLEDSARDIGTNVSTGVELQGGAWYKVETWYRRDPEKKKGRAVLWVNGKEVADSGWLSGMGRDESDAQQLLWLGIAYAAAGQPLVAYVDDVAAANHRLE